MNSRSPLCPIIDYIFHHDYEEIIHDHEKIRSWSWGNLIMIMKKLYTHFVEYGFCIVLCFNVRYFFDLETIHICWYLLVKMHEILINCHKNVKKPCGNQDKFGAIYEDSDRGTRWGVKCESLVPLPRPAPPLLHYMYSCEWNLRFRSTIFENFSFAKISNNFETYCRNPHPEVQINRSKRNKSHKHREYLVSLDTFVRLASAFDITFRFLRNSEEPSGALCSIIMLNMTQAELQKHGGRRPAPITTFHLNQILFQLRPGPQLFHVAE